MYGKLFAQMYDGTLAGNWKALVTFQQMIVLCDSAGVIDMTPEALSRRTGIPLDVIQEGIEALEAPDPSSRTPDNEGRRIERLDAHRAWGWVLVNHKKYQQMVSHEEKRAADRERIAAKRANQAMSQVVASCREVSQPVADVAYTDTDTYTDKRKDGADAPDVWTLGIDVLTRESGLSTTSARSYLGALCKQWPEESVLDALMAATGKADPKAYARKWLEDKPKRGQGRKSEADKLFDRLEAEGRA